MKTKKGLVKKKKSDGGANIHQKRVSPEGKGPRKGVVGTVNEESKKPRGGIPWKKNVSEGLRNTRGQPSSENRKLVKQKRA